MIWKLEGVSFIQAIRELKETFKKVDNYITEENVNAHFKYEFKPKRSESHLTNFTVNDLEKHNTDRARPYIMRFNRLSKLAGKYDCDILTPYQIGKCKKDTLVFDGDNCVSKALDSLLKFDGEELRIINKIV